MKFNVTGIFYDLHKNFTLIFCIKARIINIYLMLRVKNYETHKIFKTLGG